jgi:hypothetical protein
MQSFIQFKFTCPRCDSSGIILSASVNLTYLILEGFCPGCRKGVSRTYDLLLVDFSLTQADVDPDMKSMLLHSLPIGVQPAPPVSGEAS